MKKTVCELFAGVGGFRCGLNSIKSIEDAKKPEKWETVWFSQWEPADKKIQWAHDCYVNRFGTCLDLKGNDTTNVDINAVDKKTVPDHNLLVGGFPCQDYSVASSLATSKGLEGKKGVLWWDIRDMLEAKGAPFVLLENVDRLIKSPASQRGRDFAIILACFRDLGYTVEWRVINAAEYGYQQRRRRIFIFAYRDDTAYAKRITEAVNYNRMFGDELHRKSMGKLLLTDGFFARSFPIDISDDKKIRVVKLPEGIGELSSSFSFTFENSGVMKDGMIYTLKTTPSYNGDQITLGDIMEDGDVDSSFFIPNERLYYTSPDIDHSDETHEKLSDAAHKTWQYVKGAKKLPRKAKNGHEYIFSEGPVAMIDEYDKPARTMLTSEGSFNRTTHIVKDKKTGEIRLLTPIEVERIQGFPSDWTKECLVDGETVEMPVHKRRFMMGNALVVNLVNQMEEQLSEIFDAEG
ncbi:MAG: DNA (cytosine-5-)-methyltransferase [Acetatifactor sp.]|nr:DNA (cytosine-5-)-methyltransferase [Acetatifactor sp.]